jgi:hypothetical protein
MSQEAPFFKCPIFWALNFGGKKIGCQNSELGAPFLGTISRGNKTGLNMKIANTEAPMDSSASRISHHIFSVKSEDLAVQETEVDNVRESGLVRQSLAMQVSQCIFTKRCPRLHPEDIYRILRESRDGSGVNQKTQIRSVRCSMAKA